MTWEHLLREHLRQVMEPSAAEKARNRLMMAAQCAHGYARQYLIATARQVLACGAILEEFPDALPGISPSFQSGARHLASKHPALAAACRRVNLRRETERELQHLLGFDRIPSADPDAGMRTLLDLMTETDHVPR